MYTYEPFVTNIGDKVMEGVKKVYSMQGKVLLTDFLKPFPFASQVSPHCFAKKTPKMKSCKYNMHVPFQVSQTIVFAIRAITLGDHLPEITRHFPVLPPTPLSQPPE